MQATRRAFTGGLLALPLAGIAGAARAQAPPGLAAALDAIRAYAESHRVFFNLPGLTLGVTSPSGFEQVIHSGSTDPSGRAPITSDTLFQIGSISKSLVAALLHRFAQEGRLELNANIGRLMPDIRLPKGNRVTVQHVLDHVAGLPGDSPLFPPGGLWLAYEPGAHWHYSNTGYDMLGKLAEQIGGKPLSQLLEERLLRPLGMTRSRGAIIGADRTRYAQGFEAADRTMPYVRGMPLAPAGWVDVTFAAGSVASTAADMNRFLRSLANAAQGRGGLGLTPGQGRAYTSHAVPSDPPAVGYGNGFRHVTDGDRKYLHHTGGMVSFSSAFHLDVASGVGAFASSNIGYAAAYRPRALTLFAVKAIIAAEARQPLPEPLPLDAPVPRAGEYVGTYWLEDRRVDIRGASSLTLVAEGREAPLHAAGEDRFRTLHPAFAGHALWFERAGGRIPVFHWGSDSFGRAGSGYVRAPSDPRLQRLAGRFVNDSPWIGLAHVVERGGKLWLGTATPLVPIGDNLWRIGEESWSPERLWFADVLNGRPQSMFYSGDKFRRQDI